MKLVCADPIGYRVTMAEAGEKKPESRNIIVKDQQGGEVHFKVKTTTKFEKIFAAYCAKKVVDVTAIKFMFDGQRLKAEDTLADHDIEDGDIIDAMIEQIGGG